MISLSSNRRSPLILLAAVPLALLACEGDGTKTSAINASPKTGDFVIYAQRTIKLGDHDVVVGGDVGVARTVPSGGGAQLVVGHRGFIEHAHNLIAPSIELEHGADVGDVQTDGLVNHGARVGAVVAFPASMPALPLAPAAGPGGDDVFVPRGEEESLSPGDYGDVKDLGVLVLEPGAYTFASLTLGDHAELLVDGGDAEVSVTGRLSAGRGAELGTAHRPHPSHPSHPPHHFGHAQFHPPHPMHPGHPSHPPPPPPHPAAGTLAIDVAGTDGAHGVVAASLGEHARVSALLAAPRGTLRFGDGVEATGAFAAFDVKAGEHVHFVFKRGFAPSPGTQVITSYVPPPPSPVLGAVPANQVVSVEVGLPVKDLTALQAFVDQTSDPNSPNYRQAMSQADLQANQFPSDTDYAAVVSWAQDLGLKTVTFPNKLGLGITGAAVLIEQAFHANLILAQRPDGTTFYRLDGQPSVDLTVFLLSASGLDNYQLPRLLAPTGPMGAWQSSDFHSAYLGDAMSSCAGLDGSGQSIGIFSATGFVNQDILDYQTNTGLTGVPAVQVLVLDDPNGLPPTTAPPKAPTGNLENWEISLDIEMAQAMAPKAQVIVFESVDGDTALTAMANNPQIGQFSTSWLLGTTAGTQTLLTVMAAQHQTFFTGSGDWGAYLPTTSTCPAATLASIKMGATTITEFMPFSDIRTLNDVTVIGGTRLSTGADGLWSGEVTWTGTGGGILEGITIPTYQAGLNAANAEVSSTNRNLPDVSLVATNVYIVASSCNGVAPQLPTGAPIANSNPPAFVQPCAAANLKSSQPAVVGGTSASSPLWAGLMALINQQGDSKGRGRVGFPNPTFYQIGQDPTRYANAFHDIGAGGGETNPDTCGFTYNSQAGYDLATGWGTPTCGLFDEINGKTAPTTPSIVVVATEGQFGVEFCIQGQGWKPGSAIHFKFQNLPAGHFDVNSIEVQTGGADGRFTDYDETFGGRAVAIEGFVQNCDAQDLTNAMTVEAHDVNDPTISATTMILNTWICGAMPRQNDTNLTLLPFPINNFTTCPLPPD